MSVAVATEDEVDQTPPRNEWSTKLHRVGWRLYHHATKHAGVGIVCSVAYFDPWVIQTFIIPSHGMIVTTTQWELGCRSAGWLAIWIQLIVHCSPRWNICHLFAGRKIFISSQAAISDPSNRF